MPVVNQSTNPELFPLYYEKKALEYVKANLVATKYGQLFRMPRNSGRTAVFTRFEPLPVNTTPLTNQPTPSEGVSIATRQVQATIEEYGNYIDLDTFTDITSFVPLVDQATDLLAYNAQQTLDAVAMKELLGGSNVLYAGGASSRDDLTGDKPLTKTEIREAVKRLKRKNIPPFEDGYYVCFIHPDKLTELFTDQELISLAFTKKDAFETGVVGTFAGVKFVETTQLPILEVTDSNGNTHPVYQTLIFGKNAYGVVQIDGNTFQLVYTNTDKLGRVKTIGWTAYFAAKRLMEDAIVRIESN